MTLGELMAQFAVADIRRRRQLALFPEAPKRHPPCVACDVGGCFDCEGDEGEEPCGCPCRSSAEG